jgi:hypothetical protein
MSKPLVACVSPERDTQNMGIKPKPLHGKAVYLPVCAGVVTVDSFGLCTAQFALICGWPCTHATMSFALGFALHGRSTTLDFSAL